MMDEASDTFQLPRLSRGKTRKSAGRARWAEWLAQAAFATLLALVFAGPWMTDQGSVTLGAARQAGYAAVFVIALIAIRPWQRPERLLVVPWPLLLAIGWCWLSLAWSVAPLTGLRGVVLTTIVLWTTFALVRELGIDRTLATLRFLLSVLLLVNFVVAWRYPEIGIHPADDRDLAGDWRGVMGQKNFAGLTSAMTILVCAFGHGRWPLALRVAVAAAAALFLVLSDSATSLGMCVAALVVGVGFAWLAKRIGQRQLAPPWLAWTPLVVLAGVFVSMRLRPAFYLALVSNPAGFTGRTQIWTVLIQAFVDRPWLGVGYSSLWDIGSIKLLAPYTQGGRDWVAQLSQAHNGYLDLLVQIGTIGTLIVLFATVVWPLQRLLRGGDHPARALAAAILFFCLGHNFTESTLFLRDALGQVFLLIAIALLWGATAAAVAPSEASALPKRRVRSGESRTRRRTRVRTPG